jgi:ankyrin repeat protein
MNSILTGHTNIIRVLVEAGADVLIKDGQGKTVYDYCLMNDPT